MKTVIIVAPQFVPSSYPNVHRIRFFINHLEKFGWSPIILTVASEFCEDPPDFEFAQMLQENLHIIRTKAIPSNCTRKIGIGDIGIRAFPFMSDQLKKLCCQKKIHLIFITSPPWHTLLLGRKMKKKFGIPFILDYQDPWISSWGQNEPVWEKAFWFRQMALFLEPFAVRDVDHIISVSDGTNKGIRKRYSFLRPEQFTAIPLGGEPSDFDYLRSHPRPNLYWDKNDGKFHISYAGAMLPKAYGTLKALFSALLLLRKQQPAIYESFRFHFFGTTYDPNPKKGLVMPVAEEMGLDEIVSEHPRRIPYLDAINVLCHSDAIFAMGTSEPHYTASKIFPCILAKRPLLAVYHEASSVIDILRRTGVGRLITYSDTAPVETKTKEICDTLLSFITDANYKEIQSFDMNLFEDFTAQKMTFILTQVFNKVISCQADS